MSSSAKKQLAQASDTHRRAADLAREVDLRLRHLNETILPLAPYLLHIPTTYRMGSQQINDWRRGSPFHLHEEPLQYMTFHARQNDDDHIFRVDGDWDDGKGNVKAAQDKRSGTDSPLPGQTAKKKMSFWDYKKKAAGQPVTETPPPNTDNGGEVLQNPSASHTVAETREETEVENIKNESRGSKRKSDAITNSDEMKPDTPHPDSPLSKKARSSPSATPAVIKGDDLEKPPLFTLPPLLSPTHLSIEKSTVFSLPPLLSPTLPTTIEEQLTKLREDKKAVGHKSSLSEATNQEKTKPSERSIQKDSPRAAKTSVELVSIPSKISDKDTPKPLLNAQRKEQKDPTTNGVAASIPLPNGVTHHSKKEDSTGSTVTPSVSKSERRRLLIKLKIPKAARKRYAQLLKLAPLSQRQADQRTPKPTSTDGPNGDRNLVAKANGASQAEPGKDRSSPLPGSKPKHIDDKLSVSKSTEKRRRLEDDGDISEPASKRRKQPESLDLSSKPHTPLRPPLVSPILSQHGSAYKTHLSTPKRDLKSTAMRRIGSSEGDVKTPLGAVRGNTPLATSAPNRSNREGRSSSSASSGNLDVAGSERLAILKAEQGKFSGLGRTLKHTVQKMLPAENDFKNDVPVTRQGAAIAFEALLAFILSFVILDEMNRLYGKSPEVTVWRSLLGFFGYVKKVTQLFSPLRGLVHQLEGVCRDTIALYDAQRLERDAFLNSVLDDNRPSTATSNPALSPLAIEKGKAKTDFAKFRSEHADNLRTAQQTWQAGFSKLPIRELQRHFPASWAKCADTPGLGKGKDEVVVGKYMEGSYYLPLGPASTGLEAVRAGWRLLEEWCSREGVKWEGKMGL